MTDIINNIKLNNVTIKVSINNGKSEKEQLFNLPYSYATLNLNGVTESDTITLNVSKIVITVSNTSTTSSTTYTFTKKGKGNVTLKLSGMEINYDNDGKKKINIDGTLTSENDNVTKISGEITSIAMEFDKVNEKATTIKFHQTKLGGGGSPQHKTHKKSRKARKGGRRQTRYARRNKK
jgi:hypothetical protein